MWDFGSAALVEWFQVVYGNNGREPQSVRN
jgi:hypothetical protein